eukprot:6189447-Pleurochrysis_carterae.AAC.4
MKKLRSQIRNVTSMGRQKTETVDRQWQTSSQKTLKPGSSSIRHPSDGSLSNKNALTRETSTQQCEYYKMRRLLLSCLVIIVIGLLLPPMYSQCLYLYMCTCAHAISAKCYTTF